MLFFLILTLCYSVSSFDLEKTINNLKDGNLVNGLLDGLMKNNENGEDSMENLEKFEINSGLFNGLSEKKPLADFGFGRNTDAPSRARREAEPDSVPIHRFCQRIDLDCCCSDCNESDCDSDLPDSLDWSQHFAMPANMSYSSDDLVANVIAAYVALRHNFRFKVPVPKLAAEQLTDCREQWEDSLSWTGAVSRLMIQGGFELDLDYQANKTEAKCRFDETKIAVGVTSCYQLNIEKENCLKNILAYFGPILVGLREANWETDDPVKTDCNPVLDNYTPFILYGYGTAVPSTLDVWLLMRPEGGKLKTNDIPRGVACQDIGMYTIAFDVL